MPLGGPQPSSDELEFQLRGRDSPLGLLLKGMEDIDGGLEPDRIHRPIGVTFLT